MKNYDDYIVFLLGADSFKVCDTFRTLSASYGMDTMFEYCQHISAKFIEYDKKENLNISTYDSFARFLAQYEQQIDNYLFNNIDFDIKSEE